MSTENELNELLKNDLIEWINKKHSNKGNDFKTALEIVKNDDWDVLCDYTENQWKDATTNKPFLGVSIYNQINKLNTKKGS